MVLFPKKEGTNMTGISDTILKDYMVRKTKDQKTRFIDYMKGVFPELAVEEDKKNRNLVLGDPTSAKVILTAHYDTCTKMPVPNFITPMNMLVYLGYQILIMIPFLLIFWAVRGLVLALTQFEYWSLLLGYLAAMGALYYLMIGGPANPWTANDNTSGVITLVEIWHALTPEQRSQVAFVFFDNEENGLLGSGAFRKRHKKEALEQKLVLNFDCVSDGDHLLFVLNKPAVEQYGDAFRRAFPATQEKAVYVESTAKAFYPSDQSQFPVNAVAASMNKHKMLGLYMDKIHTPKDRCFDTRNIEFLRDGTIRLLVELVK